MQIFIVITVFLAANHRKQIVLLHNTKHRFRLLMYSLPFKPYMHPAVTISAVAVFLTRSNLLGKRKIPCRYIHSFDIVIVTTSRHLKEPAHFANPIFVLMAIDHHILYTCPHFLSVSERKSRMSSFSISNCLIRASFRANL